MRLDLRIQKKGLLSTKEISLNVQVDWLGYSSKFEQQILHLFQQKFSATCYSVDTYSKWQPYLTWNSPPLQGTDFTFQTLVKKIEQLGFVAHLPLIVGMKTVFLTLLGTYSVQTKWVLGNSASTKRFFSLPVEATINVFDAHPNFRTVMSLLKNKRNYFLDLWPKHLLFRGDKKIRSRWFWRGLLFWQILFQPKEMGSSWSW